MNVCAVATNPPSATPLAAATPVINTDTSAVLAALPSTKDLFAPETEQKFSVHVSVPFGSTVRVCGATPELGTWATKDAPPLSSAQGDMWSTSLLVADAHTSSHYKYVVVSSDGEVEWEEGDNRLLSYDVVPTPDNVFHGSHTCPPAPGEHGLY